MHQATPARRADRAEPGPPARYGPLPHGPEAATVREHRGPAAPPGPRPAVRRVAAPLAAAAAAAAAFGGVRAADLHEPGRCPGCPVLRLTGLACPGCGGLRSADALTRGDLPAALGANALAVAAVAVLALVWAAWLLRAVRARPAAPPWRVPGWVPAGAVLVFTVVRNLPAGAALAP